MDLLRGLGVLLMTLVHLVQLVWTEQLFYCHGDVCNRNGTVQFCDEIYKHCRHCSEISGDCFTEKMLDRCKTWCKADNDRQNNETVSKLVEEERLKGCPELQPIPNGDSNTSGPYQHGQHVAFFCHQEYKLVGPKTISCGDFGTWSGDAPLCDHIQCSVLKHVDNGYFTPKVEYFPGDKVIFNCRDGFRLVGNDTSTCNALGQWDSFGPYCEEIQCAPPPPILNGHWEIVSVNMRFTFETKGTVMCDDNHEPIGPTQWICERNSTWEMLDKMSTNTFPVCTERKKKNELLIIFLALSVVFNIVLLIILVRECCRKHQKNKRKHKNNRAPLDINMNTETTEMKPLTAEQSDPISNALPLSNGNPNSHSTGCNQNATPPNTHSKPTNLTEPGTETSHSTKGHSNASDGGNRNLHIDVHVNNTTTHIVTNNCEPYDQTDKKQSRDETENTNTKSPKADACVYPTQVSHESKITEEPGGDVKNINSVTIDIPEDLPVDLSKDTCVVVDDHNSEERTPLLVIPTEDKTAAADDDMCDKLPNNIQVEENINSAKNMLLPNGECKLSDLNGDTIPCQSVPLIMTTTVRGFKAKQL